MPKKPQPDKGGKDPSKEIRELAGELARAGIPSMHSELDAEDFAGYCLDVASIVATYEYTPPDDEGDEDDD